MVNHQIIVLFPINQIIQLDHYKALYEKLGLYEQNKAAIRRYLVDISESNLPSGPLGSAVPGAMEKWDDLTAGAASAADRL